MRHTTDPQTFERDRLALFARHSVDGRSRWLTDRAGRRTYVFARGQGRCPTVLLHGGLSQAGEWSLLAGHLPGPLVIPDRPGCGLSDGIDYRGTDLRRSASEWLRDLADGVGADAVDLVANSIGGFFAIAFALAHPERVRRLVLVGAPLGLPLRPPLVLRLLGVPVAGALLGRLQVADPAQLRRQVYPLLVAHPERVPRDVVELDAAQARLPGAGAAAHRLMRALGTLRGIRPHLLLEDELAGLAVPTLFAWGDADRFAPPSVGERVAATMPHATVAVLPDTGHVPYLESPEGVAAAVNEFPARQPAEAALRPR